MVLAERTGGRPEDPHVQKEEEVVVGEEKNQDGRPEKRLIPKELGADTEEVLEARREGATPQEEFELHKGQLRDAKKLDIILREELIEAGEDPPENANLGLRLVQQFRRKVEEAQSIRKAMRDPALSDPNDKLALTVAYEKAAHTAQEIVSQYGLSFEAAYREFLKSRRKFQTYMDVRRNDIGLKHALMEPSIRGLEDSKTLGRRERALVAAAVGSAETDISGEDVEKQLDALRSVFSDDDPEMEKFRKLIEERLEGDEQGGAPKQQTPPKNKKDIRRELTRLAKKADLLWDDPMVRWFWKQREITTYLDAFDSGDSVVETQTVVRLLNMLEEWEEIHFNTTVGGVLTGPPGTGKTTLFRHFLEKKGRNYTYIDMSEDVTRYLLYGSKSIEMQSRSEYLERLSGDLEGLDEKEFKSFVEEHRDVFIETFSLSQDEASAAVVNILQEDLRDSEAVSDDGGRLEKIRDHIQGVADKAYRAELASDFSHVIHKNGWRDGVIISALKRGESIIIDEFTRIKNWSLLHSLLEAQPGERWYFADNDEWIDIPDTWRMYFTANVGRRHGSYVVPEAAASRFQGKVEQIDYPPTREELLVGLAALSNPEGDFLRPDDLSKLIRLIGVFYGSARNLLEGESGAQSIPISYRTLRDFTEKLVVRREGRTGAAVYEATDKSFDVAMYETFIQSYALYEGDELATKLTKLAMEAGLLLDPRVSEKVRGLVGEESYDALKKAHEDAEEDDNEAILKKIRGHLADQFSVVSDAAEDIPQPDIAV